MTRLARASALGLLAVAATLVACGDDDDGGSSPADASIPDASARDARLQAAWEATLAEVAARAEELDIPGVGIAVVLDGELAYSGGVGVRRRSGDEPVTGDTLFLSTSAASKTAIALALLELAEEGRLDLHAPIGDLVPSIQLDPRYADRIDLDQLLLQRSGIDCCAYRWSCSGDDAGVLAYFDGRGVIESVAPPGAIWEYTASGAVAGAAVLETLEGRPFTEVLRDRVLEPAGMATATYDPPEAVSREHAVGHLGGREIEPDEGLGATCGERIASVGLFASAADHGRFLELLLAPGRVVGQRSLELLQGVEHDPGFGALWSYGYQAYGLQYKGVRVFHHYGTTDGYSAGTSWIPERGFGVVLLANADFGSTFARSYALEELRWRIADRFLELTGDEPDSSTPPSTWGVFTGTYVAPDLPDVRFVFAQDDAGALTVVIDPLDARPTVLAQGAPDAPYEGGDVFTYFDDDRYVIAAFFSDETGIVRYANLYSTAAGHHVAVRAEVPR